MHVGNPPRCVLLRKPKSLVISLLGWLTDRGLGSFSAIRVWGVLLILWPRGRTLEGNSPLIPGGLKSAKPENTLHGIEGTLVLHELGFVELSLKFS